MNIRREKYKQNRLSGKNQTESALEAGYSFNYATHRSHLLENVVNTELKDVFEHLGYSDYVIARKFKEKAECGTPAIEIKALEDIADMTGMRKNKLEHSGQIIVSKMPDILLGGRLKEFNLG